MAPQSMKAHIAKAAGFLAALDQSGGSTPGALRLYGIPDTAYSGEAEMFARMHEMRVRVMTAPAFTGDKVIGAILFERTMDGEAQGKPTPSYLWQDRGMRALPEGRQGTGGGSRWRQHDAADAGPRPIARPGGQARGLRHQNALDDQPGVPTGIAAIAKQQFEVGAQICKHGLIPILEPEVSIKSPEKAKAEALLKDALARHLDALPADQQVMLKLTIPDVPDLYKDLIAHDRVLRVVALSGGYSRPDACRRLARNHGMIASFSRALLEELRASMSDAEFNAALAQAIDEIYTASTVKV